MFLGAGLAAFLALRALFWHVVEQQELPPPDLGIWLQATQCGDAVSEIERVTEEILIGVLSASRLVIRDLAFLPFRACCWAFCWHFVEQYLVFPGPIGVVLQI